MTLPAAACPIVLQSLFFYGFLFSGQALAAAGWSCVRDEANCRAVIIAHDSWHAAIVLRKDDFPSGILPELDDFPAARFVEFSWGDKDYFPDPKSGFFMALKAAFWSSGSVLHVVGFEEEVKTFYPRAEIVELRLSAPAYDRLLRYISQSFSRPEGKLRAQASSGLVPYSRFYPSTRKFSAVNTCNTWVAQAIETAGLPVAPGMVISAAQLAEQLDKVKDRR